MFGGNGQQVIEYDAQRESAPAQIVGIDELEPLSTR
jgi:hypothetical protein